MNKNIIYGSWPNSQMDKLKRDYTIRGRNAKGPKDVVKHQRCKINFNTAECINMYVKKKCYPQNLSNEHVVCLDFLTPNCANI